ncbi:hypothetical protein EMIHUDRAFT_233753 [Emiliania huxleyi CCMP1516]|uniref:Glycoside hydrolase family 5 domain-containing protein n=2 Tax=Emiliania huxleyi TaxID=2903 RepID=A0A0D3K1M6_EMIH1|nr:hypothetical protein EMIHUDRAFT_233753 [Emiliania huxleyi CCMP1516]EOD29661.1 hypothetical protein EMIHUDRAFT_233753 [Emiliania huxleyi CCMP1516]|eukprot:XP_005782090.1 hypothetical protein EMIHUDRAFT_233753 [Emiliania huxleyi CCMP1516]
MARRATRCRGALRRQSKREPDRALFLGFKKKKVRSWNRRNGGQFLILPPYVSRSLIGGTAGRAAVTSPPSPSPPPYPAVAWASDPAANFSTPFEVLGDGGRLWLEPLSARHWRQELLLKGASWFGFQSDTACVHELYKGWANLGYAVDDYIAFLTRHGFNSVRLPLSVEHVASNPTLTGSCGREWEGLRSLAALDDLVRRLQDAGIYVMLGIHVIATDTNSALWCQSVEGGCSSEDEEPLFDAWSSLVTRYCASPNVIAADLYNEPFGATWGSGDRMTDWDLAAERLGNHVLARCPRWLIFVQGIANNGGWCRNHPSGLHSGHTCWWGEAVHPHRAHPIELSDASKLVLSPHAYGDDSKNPNHPGTPEVWDTHWGLIPSEEGTPVVLGEWGGLWDDTGPWQERMQEYLIDRGLGHFYWSLNDNSFDTGGLYNSVNQPKWDMLASSLASSAAVDLWCSDEAAARATYGDISGWDVSAITDMQCLFSAWSWCNGGGSTTGKDTCNPDISAWDTSAVSNMKSMFDSASSFDQDIGSWDVSAATNMRGMFFETSSFDQDIGAWDVSAATEMSGMFYGASSLSDCNKALIHAGFDAQTSAWTYSWGSLDNPRTSAGSATFAKRVTLENQQPVRSVTVTRDTNNKPSKAKKYLEDFEVWVGKKAGEKAVKCGGPFAWSKIKKGPVTTPCDFAKSKHYYVTVILPGTRKTLAFGEIEIR